MKYHDLRDFIVQLESLGELKRIRHRASIRSSK
jgi:3-polyprenyl-4-hydroxybenzoate decarboxylase